MPEALVVGIVRQAIEVAIVVSLPMLLAGLVAGVLVSIFQTVTSIQDNVLAFIPRAAAIFVVFALTFPWMLRVLSGFSADMIRRLPEVRPVTEFLPIARFAVLLVRPGALVFMAPGLGGQYTTSATKIGLTVLLALAVIPVAHVPDDFGDVALTLVIFREVAIGIGLAFAVRALIAGAEFAGHLSGFQIGFSYGATIDPQSGVRNNMLAMLYGSLATLAFLAINGHHMLLRAMAVSYQELPIGVGHIDASILTAVTQTFALVFNVAVRLAAPIVVVLIIVELAVGLISRTAPSLSMMVIGYPIRIVIGLFVLAVLIPTIPAVTTSLLDGVLELSLRFAAAFK